MHGANTGARRRLTNEPVVFWPWLPRAYVLLRRITICRAVSSMSLRKADMLQGELLKIRRTARVLRVSVLRPLRFGGNVPRLRLDVLAHPRRFVTLDLPPSVGLLPPALRCLSGKLLRSRQRWGRGVRVMRVGAEAPAKRAIPVLEARKTGLSSCGPFVDNPRSVRCPG